MNSQPIHPLEQTPESAQPRSSKTALPPLTPNATLRWDVVSRLLPARIGNALEIGCGRGAAAARIARRATSYTAVEPDDQCYSVARKTLQGNATVHNCMSFELPNAGQFDTVCAFEVLEHIEDDAGALIEWRDKLAPGGNLVISVPAFQHRFAAADKIAGHFRRYDPDHMRARLEEAGFTDIHVELYGFPAGHLLEAFRNFAAAKLLARGAEDLDIAELTAGSGRLFQPTSGLSGLLTKLLATPMVLMQRLFSNRGVGLVAKARRP